MISHILEIDTNIRTDGDINAVVVKINDTGSSSVISSDKYKHTINHNLGRVPIGCQVIMSDDLTNVRVIEKDSQKIIVRFDKARAYVHLRIW